MGWYNGGGSGDSVPDLKYLSKEGTAGVANLGEKWIATAYKDSLAVKGGFGSPAFTTGADHTHNVEDMEVKLAHRFRVKFGVFKHIGHHVKTITKPNVTFAEVEVPKLNSKVYFAGRKTQDSMTIELDDALDNAVAKGTQTQLQKQANFDTNLHAKSSAQYFFNVTAEELAGDGTALMAWYYDKCVVMTCDYGTLDYSDDAGTSSVSLGIRYSNFTTWMHTFVYGSATITQTDKTNGPSSKPGDWANKN
jgi:hypothetical protein